MGLEEWITGDKSRTCGEASVLVHLNGEAGIFVHLRDDGAGTKPGRKG